jgi:hypothetical protein
LGDGLQSFRIGDVTDHSGGAQRARLNRTRAADETCRWWNGEYHDARAVRPYTKLLRQERDTKGVEQGVKYGDLVRSGRQAVDLEPAQGIGLDRRPPTFDYDIGTREISAVEAVYDYTQNLPLTGLRRRRGRRRCVLRAKHGRSNRDQSDR